MIVLALDDTNIAGYGHKITCEQPLPDDDLSGQSSSSLSAENGIKPKRLRVSLNIKYSDIKNLAELVLLSTETTEDGSRKKYKIVNQTAAAFNIRQVRFSERFSAQELDGAQAWSVTFVLVEQLSVPEKVEEKRVAEKEPDVPIADQGAAGKAKQSDPVGGIEKVIAWLDYQLAEESGATDEV